MNTNDILGIYDHFALSQNWLRTDILSDEISLRWQTAKNPASYHGFDGMTLFYIDSGKGSLHVNGRITPLKKGSCGLLNVCHFYHADPAPSKTLRIFVCEFSFKAFAYLMSVPGGSFAAANPEEIGEPVLADLSETDQRHMQRILNLLIQNKQSGRIYDQTTLLSEWIVRLYRNI